MSLCAILSFWDSLEPSYTRNLFFDICSPKGEKGGCNFAKPRFSVCVCWGGGQGLKTNLYTKIHDQIFCRMAWVILNQWKSGHSFIYIDIYLCVIFFFTDSDLCKCFAGVAWFPPFFFSIFPNVFLFSLFFLFIFPEFPIFSYFFFLGSIFIL